jgi:hypothetical protein
VRLVSGQVVDVSLRGGAVSEAFRQTLAIASPGGPSLAGQTVHAES